VIVEITAEKKASLTFSEGMMKVFLPDSSFKIKWFKDHDFMGEMDLVPGTWGGFEHGNDLIDWRIEFYLPEDLENAIYVHNYRVNRGNVLVLPRIAHKRGKLLDVDGLIDFCKSIKMKGASVYVYFEGSELFDFEKYGIKPLRLNQEIVSLTHILEIQL
jgi:hypothetical protein